MSFPILGVPPGTPRKGMGGFLWFANDVPKAAGIAIARAVPRAVRSGMKWKSPAVLAVGTDDDASFWAEKAGSWGGVLDQVLRFLAHAHELAPVAFYLGGASFAGPRDSEIVTSTVFPRVHAWFDATPVARSADHDLGSFVAYWCFRIVEICVSKKRPIPEEQAWRALMKAALGRSFNEDLHRILAFGPPRKDVAISETDPREILPVLHKLPVREARRVPVGHLLEQIVAKKSVNADWFASALTSLGLSMALGGGRTDPPRTRFQLRELERTVDAARRAYELGSGAVLSRALWSLGRSAGAWDLEVSAVRALLADAPHTPSAIEHGLETLIEAMDKRDSAVADELVTSLREVPAALLDAPSLRLRARELVRSALMSNARTAAAGSGE